MEWKDEVLKIIKDNATAATSSFGGKLSYNIVTEKNFQKLADAISGKQGKGSHTTLSAVIKVVDEWLNSNDVFITDGKGGNVIPNAWIDCIKGSLLKRMAKII